MVSSRPNSMRRAPPVVALLVATSHSYSYPCSSPPPPPTQKLDARTIRTPASAKCATRASPPAATLTSAPLVDDASRPLQHKRVAFTAQAADAGAFANALAAAGARPVWCPVLHAAPLSEAELEPLDDAILRLAEYRVLAFISPSAVNAFIERALRLSEGDPAILATMLQASDVQVAAFGPAVQRLRSVGISAQVVPLEHTARGLALALESLGLCGDGASVLLPATRACGTLRPDEGEPELVLARSLTEAGASVSALAAYSLGTAEPGSIAEELDWMRRGAVDALCVGSEYEVRGLAHAAADELGSAEAPLLVASAECAAACRGAGLEVGMRVEQADPAHMVAALTELLGARKLIW